MEKPRNLIENLKEAEIPWKTEKRQKYKSEIQRLECCEKILSLDLPSTVKPHSLFSSDSYQRTY